MGSPCHVKPAVGLSGSLPAGCRIQTAGSTRQLSSFSMSPGFACLVDICVKCQPKSWISQLSSKSHPEKMLQRLNVFPPLSFCPFLPHAPLPTKDSHEFTQAAERRVLTAIPGAAFGGRILLCILKGYLRGDSSRLLLCSVGWIRMLVPACAGVSLAVALRGNGRGSAKEDPDPAKEVPEAAFPPEAVHDGCHPHGCWGMAQHFRAASKVLHHVAALQQLAPCRSRTQLGAPRQFSTSAEHS